MSSLKELMTFCYKLSLVGLAFDWCTDLRKDVLVKNVVKYTLSTLKVTQYRRIGKFIAAIHFSVRHIFRLQKVNLSKLVK